MHHTAAAMLILLMAGCSSSGRDVDPSSEEPVPYATFPERQPNQVFLDSFMEGEVVVQGGCLYVEDKFNRRIPAFEEGQASWDADAEQLRVGETTLKDGDRVRLRGGSVRRYRELSIPNACDRSSVFMAQVSSLE